jgi:hypothetical protein
MFMFLLNKTYVENLDKHRRGFFWGGKGKNKVPYGQMDDNFLFQKERGLGVKDHRKKTISIHCK